MNNIRKRATILLTTGLISLLACASILACNAVDQEQLVTASTGTWAVNNDPASEQKLAQTFTVGADGFLTQIRVPIGCSSGELIIEIRKLNEDGEPGEDIVSIIRVSYEDLPAPIDFKTIFLPSPIPVESGDQFAIVFKNLTGSCGILQGPEGDSYAGGKSFYDARPNPPGWVGNSGDIPFQTVVDDGSSCGGSSRNYCTFGGTSIPFPFISDAPICGCVTDSVLNSWHCRVLHPDFLFIRRIPFPPYIGGRVSESWSFTPLTTLSGPVKLSFKGVGVNKPIVYEFGKKSKVGSFEYFKMSRSILDVVGPIDGRVSFSYPKKNASAPYQKEFDFDATVPATKMKNSNDLKKGKGKPPKGKSRP